MVTHDEMKQDQFDQMISTGLDQARAGDSFDVDEVFDELEQKNECSYTSYKILNYADFLTLQLKRRKLRINQYRAKNVDEKK